MDSKIRIIEKPETVSWDAIRRCLIEAHAPNRARKIKMSHYRWPAEKIRESLGERGVMLVAMDGDHVVGTAALAEREHPVWYAGGRYAYLCFDGVIPGYTGQGIFSNLDERREALAQEMGYRVLVFDTHVRNKSRQEMAIDRGYRRVRIFRAKSGDHNCVVLVKWLDGCPYSRLYCRWKLLRSRIKTLLKSMFSRG